MITKVNKLLLPSTICNPNSKRNGKIKEDV